MRRVSIIQREIPHYRIRFFEELYAQGKSKDLDIHVYTGMSPSKDSPAFPFHVLPLRQLGKKTTEFYWMCGLENALAGSDTVVAPQELQCLTVPYLWTKRKRICSSWIWWGHGYNFQASIRPSIMTTAKEALKRFMTRRADGIITYTGKGTEFWRKEGLPADRVFPYYNTIDVEGLRKIGQEVTRQQLSRLRRKLALDGKHVLLFSGRLYAEKKVDFLLNAFAILKSTCPNVALLIIGDGDERRNLQRLAGQLGLQDVHFLGEVINPIETSAYFLLADLMVIPGLVGLAIVHGFAFGLPLITTRHDFHSPEIEYLSTDSGSITNHDVTQYGEAIAHTLSSPLELKAMRQSATARGSQLQLSRSVSCFASGIVSLSAINSR